MICEDDLDNEPGTRVELHVASGRKTETEARAALLVKLVEMGVVTFGKAAT